MGNTYLGQNNIAQTITSADKSVIQVMTSFSASDELFFIGCYFQLYYEVTIVIWHQLFINF